MLNKKNTCIDFYQLTFQKLTLDDTKFQIKEFKIY